MRDDSDVSLIVEVLQLATDEGAGENLDKAVRWVIGSGRTTPDTSDVLTPAIILLQIPLLISCTR